MSKRVSHLDKAHLIAEYLLLGTAGVFFLVLIALLRSQPIKQFGLLLTFAVFYVGWAVIHHIKDRTFHIRILLEYILIGSVVLVLARLVFFP